MSQNTITAFILRGSKVEWTSVKTVKGRVEVVDHQSVSLGEEIDSFLSPDFGEALKKICGHIKGQVCVAVPSDRALMRVADLPTTDPDEMAGMAELQVDKFSPFPVEQVGVSFEQLSVKGETTRVLIGSVQNEIIEGIGNAFRTVGLLPHWIDIEVMAWWWILKQQGEIPEDSARVTLIVDESGAELIISDKGVPLVVRSLGTAFGVSREEYLSEVADEVGYSLTTLEADRGLASNMEIVLWYREDEAESSDDTPPKISVHNNAPKAGNLYAVFMARLGEVCELSIRSRNIDDLPPLSEGLARRTLERKGQVLDLTPPSWHSEEQAHQTRKTLLIASIVFLTLWLSGLAVFLGGLGVEKKKLAEMKTQVDAVEGPAEEVRMLKEKIDSFQAYADRSHSVLETLREITILLPANIDLTSFNYRKAGSVSVRGIAARPDPIYDFFQGLEQSDFFIKVKPGGVRNRKVNNQQKSEFSVTLDLPGSEKEEASP